MTRLCSTRLGILLALGSVAGCVGATDASFDTAEGHVTGGHGDPFREIKNPAGKARTMTPDGVYADSSAFFQSLGTNGRTCNTCHRLDQGWSLTVEGINRLFDQTDGLDVLFHPVDGTNSPNADISTRAARRRASSQLLTRGVIRVGRPVPANAEFTVVEVHDPAGYATPTMLQVFRRPLPVSNLTFLSTVNWDGRSNLPDDPTNIHQALLNQSNGATVNHAQATAPIDVAVREDIVAFETSLFHAQEKHSGGGKLYMKGARGGVDHLVDEPFTPGETAQPVFTLYAAWAADNKGIKADIAHGERVFNFKTFGNGATCASCHNGPNNGANTGFRFFDIGVSDPSRRAPDQTLYVLEHDVTGERIATTDPGRGLITGAWADINKFKVPTLRGLAARAPYFHDGSAPTIAAVVEHYEARFNIQFTRDEKANLIKFLESL